MRATHTEPSLFEPETIPFDSLTVTVTVHLDGPQNRSEAWVTISHALDGQLACFGPDRGTCGTQTAPAAAEIMADAVRTALRQLRTF